MIELIEQTDWQSLGYPQMAEWLLGLISDDEKVHYPAYNNLYIHVFHGDDFELNGPHYYNFSVDDLTKVMPILLTLFSKMLTGNVVRYKSSILQLIVVVAGYATYPDIPENMKPAAERLNRGIADDIQLIAKFLDDEDSVNRATAAVIIRACSENYTNEAALQLVSKLLYYMKTDQVVHALTAMSWAIGSMFASYPSLPDELANDAFHRVIELLEDPHKKEASAYASVSLLQVLRGPVSQRVLNALASSDIDYRIFPDYIDAVEKWDVKTQLQLLLTYIETPRKGLKVALAIIKFLDLVTDNAHIHNFIDLTYSYDAGNNLRNIIFGYAWPPDLVIRQATPLTPEQKADLSKLTEIDWIWDRQKIKWSWARYTNVLQLYGLPASRDEMRALLGQ